MSRSVLRKTLLGLSVCLAASWVVPNASAALDGVTFKVAGGDEDVTATLRGASLLLALESTEADDIFAAARGEYGRLIGALYAKGRYSPVISVKIDGREASSIAPLDAPSRVGKVEVSVEPGPVFRFSKTRIDPLARGTDLPSDFKPGEVAESDVVRQAVDAAVEGWRDKGYAKAEVANQSVVADHRASQLAVDVGLAPGPRLRFGAVAIEGNERTRTNRVRKIAGLPEGERFSPAEIERAANRLRRTGTFSSVSIAEDENVTPPDLLGTTISVVEEKPRRLSFGAELSSLDGLNLKASWMHRNMFRGAEKLVIDAEIAQIAAQNTGVDYRLGLSLERPATLTPDTTLRFSVEYAHLDEGFFTADGVETSIGFSHVFSDELTGRIDIGYEHIDGEFFARDRSRIGSFLYRTLTLPVGVTWDKRDSKTDAKKGFYIDAEVKPFLGFGTTGSGLRAYGDLRTYYGVGEEDKLVFAGRVQAGAVFGSTLLNTPRDDLFLSGGGGTVRGQPYQSLGITVPAGASSYTIGGNRFLAGSLEARMKVTENIGVVGFVDAGRVDQDAFFGANGDWHAGAGFGLRYDTGIGPIRLDVAAPVSGKTGKGVQIYVGLGQAF
ncbi:autotransporter assembly complex protein TamA [Thioclava sp. FR2]|uniref:autotransporter assembly complex protein TamA n=1 Tax=Thioclava sp. FR2 TaxID=3445780 RepID=UPI003EB9E81B